MKTNQTKNDLNYHIIFATKNREKCLTTEHFSIIRDLAKEKSDEIGIIVQALNGYIDHVHILISIPPKLSVSYVVKRLKGYFSYKLGDIYWQDGYAVFVVERKNFKRVCDYIYHQDDHHKFGNIAA